MKYTSIFDVIGHIMVGPSSSHTAGACQIAYVARLLFGKKPKSVKIGLHGSFAETYKGHGTDIAILAGLLGFTPEDDMIKHAFEIAEKEGLDYSFEVVDLGADYHPNSVSIEMFDGTEKMNVIGSSIGGGNIIIKEVDGLEAGFGGEPNTLVILNHDRIGALVNIANTLQKFKLNIGSMKISRNLKKKIALTWLEADTAIPEDVIDALKDNSEIIWVRVINV
ncbi:MAG: L-serine ammonia-lyase, iron-sulfur-dependent, subunit beta [Candidatus Lokiarchaeota archaeon]|nr:L-serine ammonia-lyase, iron-sulfur-dependent, subunit beta [Candidatus Lokiarchaeota archaeon]